MRIQHPWITRYSTGASVPSGFTLVAPRRVNTMRVGFTLVELLMVMVIIAILLGIVIGIAVYAQRAALEGKARAAIEQISNGLTEYHAKYYTYPETSDIKAKLPAYMTSAVDFDNDPWGTPYQYAKIDSHRYTLFSCGHDKMAGTPDDISTGN